MNFMDRKVWAGGLTGLGASALVWGAQAKFGITLPPEVAAMLITFLVTSVAYMVPPSVKDVVKRIDGAIIDIVAADPKIPLVKVKDAPAVVTKVTNPGGGTLRSIGFVLALLLLAPALGACSMTAAPGEKPTAVQQAIADAKSLTPEQKWDLLCNGADLLYVDYKIGFEAKASIDLRQKVDGGYASVLVVCKNRPENVVTGIITLQEAYAAFKASIPKA